ncbi:DUF2721 domain-containing protein [bacterium]|nr:DUF2721 domain-containing protein [bacterium]
MDITTPALLFPAISLLFLSYNNRFLTLAQLIRELHAEYLKSHSAATLAQIRNLKLRLQLIQWMQFLGVFSFVLAVVCMLLLLDNQETASIRLFGIAILSLMVSLIVALWEIMISIGALKVLLKELESEK